MLSFTKSRFAGKITSLLFIAIFILPAYTLAQEGWFEQSFYPADFYHSVCFVDENIGWIVGDERINGNGSIYKTTNGGIDWQWQIHNTIAELYSVDFVNESIGWVVGGDGTILKTSNGGEIWEDKSFSNHSRMTSVQFIDENIGYATGGDKLIKTTDGGETWEIKLESGTNLFFIDSVTGWVLDYGVTTLHKTTNGGEDWILLPQLSGCMLIGSFFINDSIGWYYGDQSCIPMSSGVIRKTTNGGLNWVTQIGDTMYWGYSISSVFFIDENNGWAAGWGGWESKGIILRTTNGGEDWITQFTTGHFKPFYSVYFIDENNGWAVGGLGTIFRTTNGGVSFVEEQELDEIPTDYNLSQNFPNPFNPSTAIKYSVPQSSNVVIKIFDILGNEVETLVNEEKSIGTYEITWYAEKLPSGVYFYRLQAGDPSAGSGQGFVETKKMILLK